MKRIWSIEEQHVNDEASGFGFTFASHPDEDGDNTVSLTIYNESRNKKIILVFDRNGQKITSGVEPHDLREQAAEALAGTDTLAAGQHKTLSVNFTDDKPVDEPAPETHHWRDEDVVIEDHGTVVIGPGGDTLAAGTGT